MTTCKIHCQLHYKIVQATELIFLVHAAHHPDQTIINETLSFNLPLSSRAFQDACHHNRHTRMHVEPCDRFELNYSATVQLHPQVSRELQQHFNELNVTDLPDEVLPYLLSSRYCDADALMDMAQRSFGWMTAGYARVKAIEEWIYHNIFYVSGSSNSFTTSTDVLVQRAGVCRDFAHLGIALCRALGIPARIVVGYVDIEKFLPDFHAIFEVYLDGGWVLFDPTRLAPVENLVRIATGVDASDVAFATFYGEIELLKIEPLITYTR